MSQMRIFLSHSSQDKAFADALVKALRGAGADVWYDEHNQGAGLLLNDIQREIRERPVFIVILSKAAFASQWVRDECRWAWNLYRREPSRIILPVVAKPIEPQDFDGMLFLEDFKRVDGPSHQPYPPDEVTERALRLLELAPTGLVAAPAAPQPSESADDLVTRGKALAAQGREAQAISLFERATQLAPSNFSAWFNLGYAYDQAQRQEAALGAYDHALALNPDDAVTWNNRAAALVSLSRYREALAAAERAIALKPDYALAWNTKASVLLFKLGRDREALEAAERAITLQPDFAAAWTNKAWALIRLNRNREALEAVERALSIGRTVVRWRIKALALRALGRAADAREAERWAQELGG